MAGLLDVAHDGLIDNLLYFSGAAKSHGMARRNMCSDLEP